MIIQHNLRPRAVDKDTIHVSLLAGTGLLVDRRAELHGTPIRRCDRDLCTLGQ